MNLYKLFRRVDREMILVILDYLDKFTIIAAAVAAIFSIYWLL